MAMRTRWTAVLLALVALVAMAIAAYAAPIANGVGPELVSDQQDVLLDSTGRATMDFRDGDNSNACLSSTPIVTFTPARTLTAGKPAPVTVSAGQNTPCTIVILVRDRNNQPIGSALVRLTYHAIVKGSADIPTPPPAP
jgi:hypothetical protein